MGRQNPAQPGVWSGGRDRLRPGTGRLCRRKPEPSPFTGGTGFLVLDGKEKLVVSMAQLAG